MKLHIDKNSNVDVLIGQVKMFVMNLTSNESIISRAVLIASEIIYNTIKYTHKGELELDFDKRTQCLMLISRDQGNGFSESVELALQEGFSTSGTLGIGLPSIIRLSDEISIKTGQNGTVINVTVEL